MAKRGPKPTPKSTLKLRGSWRGDLPENVSEQKAKKPRMPSWLTGEAKKKWKSVSKILFEAGKLTESDADMLALYCDAYAEYLATRTKLEELREQKADEKTLLSWTKTKQRIWQSIVKLAGKFGLEPEENRILALAKTEETPKESRGEKWVNKQSKRA